MVVLINNMLSTPCVQSSVMWKYTIIYAVQVLQFRKTLAFPLMSDISVAAMALIDELLRKESQRLGRKGLKEVKAHAFFVDLQWDRLGTGAVSVPVTDEQVYRCVEQVHE